MKKRIPAFLLTLLIFAFTSCEQGGTPVETNHLVPVMSEQVAHTTSDSEATQPVAPAQEFAEVIAVDNEACTIKITKIDADSFFGYTLKAYLENKSSDKTYMFSVDGIAVDGVSTNAFSAEEVAPGKKANTDITILDSNLEDNGITDFTDIEITFRVYDSNDWSADDVAKETVHIYPYGEQNAKAFERVSLPTDVVLFDNEYASATVIGYEKDAFFGYTVKLFLVNKTDKEVMFSTEEASVNGFMADPFFATSLAANKCTFSDLTWSDTVLEDNGITEIEEIEMLFRVYDYSDWSAEDFVNQTVTIKP